MNRNHAAVLIFFTVLTVSLVHLALLKRATDNFTECISRCRESYISDSTDCDLRLAELTASWEDYHGAAAFLTRSEMLAEMAASVARLGGLSLSDKGDVISELDALRYQALIIYDDQVPHLSSIL